MRGHIRQRHERTCSNVIDIGRVLDPETGLFKRKQQWETVRGTKKDAQRRLAEKLHHLHQGQVVSPSKITLAEWLEEWLNTAIRPHRRIRTVETYQSIIQNHLKPELGGYRLCDLRASHLQAYYEKHLHKRGEAKAWATFAGATLQQHHTILFSSLKAAVKQGLIPRNVAELVLNKPRPEERPEGVLPHCWEPAEAQKFLVAAKAASLQEAALYALALTAGPRKAELCGLKWSDIDFDRKTMSITRQLVKIRPAVLFGPPKNGRPRVIPLGTESLELLRRHKVKQAEQRLLLGTAYHEHGLVFARDFGDPLLMNNLGQRSYARIIKAAGVRPIKFHGLRHTCATLMLKQNVPVKVVSERLGHKKTEITLDVYAHVLPSMQEEAATNLDRLLHG